MKPATGKKDFAMAKITLNKASRLTGHPSVIDGHRVLSTWVIGTAKERGLVLTFSGQLYRLGRPGRPPDGDARPALYDTADAESAPMSERLH
jgi:hypothetical protein